LHKGGLQGGSTLGKRVPAGDGFSEFHRREERGGKAILASVAFLCLFLSMSGWGKMVLLARHLSKASLQKHIVLLEKQLIPFL
jgi:hypothetical protein